MSDLIITGLERALIGFRDALGISTGQQSTLADGATSGAFVCKLPYTAAFEALPPVNVNIDGGDKLYTIVQFGSSKTQPFDLILSNYPSVLVTLISGAVPNVVNTKATVMSDNPNLASPRVLWLGLQSRAQDVDTGDAYYVTRFFPACQMRIKRRGPAFQAKSDIVVNCTPQMASKSICGEVFGTAGLALALTDDKTDNYDYISARPIHPVSFRQNTGITSFNTVYKPISTVVTLNATPNAFYIGGVPTALASITLPGVATLSVAGTLGVCDVLLHETDYVPV